MVLGGTKEKETLQLTTKLHFGRNTKIGVELLKALKH